MARSGGNAGRSAGGTGADGRPAGIGFARGTGADAGRAGAGFAGKAGADAVRANAGFVGRIGADAVRAGPGFAGDARAGAGRSAARVDRPASGVRRLARETAASRKSVARLAVRLERLALDLEKAHFAEYVELMRRPRDLIWRNLLAGVARGVGIAVGFTFFAATIVWFLQALGALNLPIVGDYIADIVRIVQRQLDSPY